MPPEQPRMTLEEARATMWLRNAYRPMGELLDEGYLDQGRLAWAAQKAYSPQIKEAAAVLLEWLKQAPAKPQPPEATPAINAGLTIEQARATPWPFRPFRDQAMGPLVDTRQIGPKDLGRAIETAWDDRVRRAAIALMAVSLEQAVEEPPPPAGPVKVVSSGPSYAERQQILLSYLAGYIAGVLLLVPGLLLLALYQNPSSPSTAQPKLTWAETVATPRGIVIVVLGIGLLAAIVVLPMLLAAWSERQFNKRIANHRRGQEGETRVVETLCSVLDGSWTLFRNVDLPGRGGDLDLVLVGPAGVWVLEVKTLNGEYRNVGEQWEYKAGKRWKSVKKNPSRQARKNAGRLGGFLRADKIKQWVNGVVVWANPEGTLTVDNPMVAVWELDRLPDELGNLCQDRKVDEATQARIVEKLTRLGEKGRG